MEAQVKKIIKSGDRALWDTFSGLIKVRIEFITGKSGEPNSCQKIELTVMQNWGSYKKGEIHYTSGTSIVHKNSVVKRGYHYAFLGDYELQAN